MEGLVGCASRHEHLPPFSRAGSLRQDTGLGCSLGTGDPYREQAREAAELEA